MADTQKMCKACAYFEVRAQECHRYAPRPIEMADQKKIRWPSTPPIGWCGEFLSKE